MTEHDYIERVQAADTREDAHRIAGDAVYDDDISAVAFGRIVRAYNARCAELRINAADGRETA